MKIHNKGKGWSFFGKALLWSTALIFVSCGFNTQKKENSNIADFVDFIDLGLSVEEKEEPTFGLAGGFNLVAEGLNCKKIDYSWEDSASGYNPNEEAQPIEKVKFIDKDQFTIKVTSFHCEQAGSGTLVEYNVFDPTSNGGQGEAYTFVTNETRLYVADNFGDLEVTQTGDCITASAGGLGDGVPGCSEGSTIAFTLTSFKVEDGEETIAAASFQKEVAISFTNGEPVPALELKHMEYLEDTFNPGDNEGHVHMGQVWRCLIDNDPGYADSVDSKCSGQFMKNLSIVLIDNKSIDQSNGNANAFANPGDATIDELKAAIEYLDDKRAKSMAELKANHLIVRSANPKTAIGNTDAFAGYSGQAFTGSQHGLKAQSKSSDGFYDHLTKYACIYSVSVENDQKNWSKLGAKCKKVVFTPIDPDTQGFEAAE